MPSLQWWRNRCRGRSRARQCFRPLAHVSNLLKARCLETSDNYGLGRKYQQVELKARVADAKATMAIRTRGENILIDLKFLSWRVCLV